MRPRGPRRWQVPAHGGQDRARGTGQRTERHNAWEHPDTVHLQGQRWRPGDMQDMPHLQLERDGVARGVLAGDSPGGGGTSQRPSLTWDLRMRRSAEERASSCSMFLSMPDREPKPSPSGTLPGVPRRAHPSPRGQGGPAGPGDAAGTVPLTLQLVADAVGHFLDVRCQLLQVVFGLCRVTRDTEEATAGNVPWGGLGWGGTHGTHSARGWGPRG